MKVIKQRLNEDDPISKNVADAAKDAGVSISTSKVDANTDDYKNVYGGRNNWQSAEEYKQAYDSSYDIKERMNIVKQCLEKNGVKKTDWVGTNISTASVDDWVNAMKWDEICEPRNVFMNTLKMDKDGTITSNMNNFFKCYNAYVDELYSTDDLIKCKNNNIVFVNDLYRQSQDNVSNIIKAFYDDKSRLYANLGAFYEKNKDGTVNTSKVKPWENISKSWENTSDTGSDLKSSSYSKWSSNEKIDILKKLLSDRDKDLVNFRKKNNI